MVSAHRTGWHYAPENSLRGVQICIDMGVDILETDVHKTKDGHFIMMHDKTLERTTNGQGKISDWNLNDLQKLRLKDFHGKLTDDPIPTLDQVMETSRGHILVYLDKTEDDIDEVYTHLQEIHATSYALFYGERPLAELHSRYGELIKGINYLPKIYDSTPDLDRYIADFAQGLSPAAFPIEFKTDDSPVIAAIPAMRKVNARVWASPLWPQAVAGRTDVVALKHPEQSWGWMIDRGVTMFCTDEPKELLKYLRARGLHG